MRVTGGSARGRRLKSPRAGVRPTTDLVRAAIFDMLEARGLPLGPALDLYAGSGALGIEALSRGAAFCDFVERDAANVALIKENLAITEFAERGRVYRIDAARAAGRLDGPYVLVLADPPYDDEAASGALLLLVEQGLVDEAGVIVLEHRRVRTPLAALGLFSLWRTRNYGDSAVSIYHVEQAGEDRHSTSGEDQPT